MSDSWHATSIEVEPGEVELASHLLYAAGCNGIVEENSPSGEKTKLTAYFDAGAENAGALERRLKKTFSSFPSLAGLTPSTLTRTSNDWQRNWRQWFKPFSIVPGIFVKPSWEEFSPGENSCVITLDPKMAFGTGLHETTKLCAETIHGILKPSGSDSEESSSASGRVFSLLDVGTGSGLLAIVAGKLGAKRIAAIENDPDALAVAIENFEINGICDAEAASSIASVDGEFDIVVANILLSTLIELKDELVSRMTPGGKLILSGITNDQEEKILSSFSPPLALVGTTRLGEWSCMVFESQR